MGHPLLEAIIMGIFNTATAFTWRIERMVGKFFFTTTYTTLAFVHG